MHASRPGYRVQSTASNGQCVTSVTRQNSVDAESSNRSHSSGMESPCRATTRIMHHDLYFEGLEGGLPPSAASTAWQCTKPNGCHWGPLSMSIHAEQGMACRWHSSSRSLCSS